MSPISSFIQGLSHGSKFHVALKFISKSKAVQKKIGLLLVGNLIFYGLFRLIHEMHQKAL